MNSFNELFLQWFRDAAPYMHMHRGKTFVILLPGDCLEHPNFINIISDISMLHSLGVRVVVVHGARLQIEEELNHAGIKSVFHRGDRITDREHLPHILKAVGATRWHLEACFSSGLPNSPMYGAKIKVRGGNLITAMPQGVIDGIDHQMTGKVRRVDSEAIDDILGNGGLPLLSPLGFSVTGEVFNLSFAEIGIAVGSAICADKVIVYNDDGPVYDKEGKLYREMTQAQCKQFLEGQELHAADNSYFSLRTCYAACRKGVLRAHVISSSEDGSLLKELFTRDGSGTMVYSDQYEIVRRAQPDDVVGIVNLIAPLENEGILVKRSRELLENEINYFTVIEKDNLIVGCAALYPIKDSGDGELACVAVRKEYQQSGRARDLLANVEKQAVALRMENLYTLTTRTLHWFLEQGFNEVAIDTLPSSRKALYNYQRNSKVLVKELSADR